MKRFLCVLIIVAFAFSTFVISAVSENIINVIVNDTEIEFAQSPIIVNNRTLVPMRAIFEALCAVVEWDNDTQTIIAVCEVCKTNGITHNITLKIGDSHMYTYREKVVHGEQKLPGMSQMELDVPPMLVGGYALVPLRAVAENFSCDVIWDDYNNRVIIREEREIDINSPEVQKIYNDTIKGEAFMCYYNGYTDISLLDSTDNILGGIMREIISVSSIRNDINKNYSDEEASAVIGQFLQKNKFSDDVDTYFIDLLKDKLDGKKTTFKISSEVETELEIVGLLTKNELEVYNNKLFGKELPKVREHGLPVSYCTLFLWARNNITNKIFPALRYIIYCSQENDEYLLVKMTGYSIEDYFPLKSDTKLLRATSFNDEISLYVYHEGEFNEYSGGKNTYKGTYKNTYKKNGENFYWVSSNGYDESI